MRSLLLSRCYKSVLRNVTGPVEVRSLCTQRLSSKSKMADSTGGHVGREGLEQKLKEWNIDYTTIEHPPVFTVEASLPYMEGHNGIFGKNLFLKDKKKRLYLLCAPHDADVKLNDLAKLVGASGGLRFADESILKETLGVIQGAVTLFAIINDTSNAVQLVLDKRLVDGTYKNVIFHPMVNTASLCITMEGLQTFVKNTNHEPKIVDLSN